MPGPTWMPKDSPRRGTKAAVSDWRRRLHVGWRSRTARKRRLPEPCLGGAQAGSRTAPVGARRALGAVVGHGGTLLGAQLGGPGDGVCVPGGNPAPNLADEYRGGVQSAVAQG